jgi:hypothetical protein
MTTQLVESTFEASPPSLSRRDDDQGHFLKGNAGGPGNPHARHCARMLEMFRNSITDEEMFALCRVLFARASSGDMAALKMIWQYKLGKPLPAPNPDAVDRDEWDHFQKDAMSLDEMKRVLTQYPTRLGNAIVSAALPSIVHKVSRDLAAQLIDSLPPEYLTNPSNSPAPNSLAPDPSALGPHSPPESNGFSTAQPEAAAPNIPSPRPSPLAPYSPATHSHPIANGDLPPLDADGLPVRTYQHTPPAKHSSPVSNGNSTARSKGEAPVAPSRATRHAPRATRSPVSNGNSTARSKGEAPVAPPRATRHAPLATTSSSPTPTAPIANGKSKAGSKKKKARNSLKNQWLDPIAKKCQTSRKRSRQRACA